MAGRGAVLALFAVLAGLGLALTGGRAPLAPGPFGVVLTDAGPAAGARVRVKGAPVGAFADDLGRFPLSSATLGRRVTAWKEGHFIAGARAGRSGLELRLSPLPVEDHEGYEWVSPTPDPADAGRCGNCHQEMYREWAGSGHARSATGQHFRALYDDLVREKPLGADVCAACHAPTAADGDLRRVRGVAALGVHCDYCHKVSGQGEGEVGLTHGRFLLKLLRPAEGQLFFGPLDDVDRGEDAYSPFYRDSRYCAACHEGVVFGVHVYSTYSEWLDSPARRAGQHCQDCHMRPTGRMINVAPGRGGVIRHPGTLGNHLFWDGSQLAMLRRSLRLSASARLEGPSVRVAVRLVAEGVGHRVPTGFIDRQVILVVEGLGRDGAGAAPIGGPRLPVAAGPALAGQAGRIYARSLADEEGRSPVPFWRGPAEPRDTRLSPGVPDAFEVTYPRRTETVRLRVLHRRFWEETARAQGWPDRDLVVIDTVIAVKR